LYETEHYKRNCKRTSFQKFHNVVIVCHYLLIVVCFWLIRTNCTRCSPNGQAKYPRYFGWRANRTFFREPLKTSPFNHREHGGHGENFTKKNVTYYFIICYEVIYQFSVFSVNSVVKWVLRFLEVPFSD
jgi:hypothetical protein